MIKGSSLIEKYIAEQPEATRALLKELRACILKAAPDAEELINYNIPAFALIPGGKRDQQIMMAGYAKHVGLYPGAAVIEKFADELKHLKFAKGSIQFPLNKPLPKQLISRMVKVHRELIKSR